MALVICLIIIQHISKDNTDFKMSEGKEERENQQTNKH